MDYLLKPYCQRLDHDLVGSRKWERDEAHRNLQKMPNGERGKNWIINTTDEAWHCLSLNPPNPHQVGVIYDQESMKPSILFLFMPWTF